MTTYPEGVELGTAGNGPLDTKIKKISFLKMSIYTISVAISSNYCGEYWVVGPCFGVSYLIINFERLKKYLWPKGFLFLIISTFTYAAVRWIADQGLNLPWGPQKGWHFRNEILDLFLGPFSGGVVFGSLTLPFAQGVLFFTDFKIVKKTWVTLISSWVMVLSIGHLYEALNLPGTIPWIPVAIALWQGIFLYTLNLKDSRN